MQYVNDGDKKRFFSKISIPIRQEECWEWLGTKHDKFGYGSFSIGNKDFRAHRVSYMIFNGRIPKDKLVLHACDNPGCVSPKHLYIGTYQDNANDKVNRGRSVGGSCRQYGKENGMFGRHHTEEAKEKMRIANKGKIPKNAKLTIENVKEIRLLIKDGELSQIKIAKKFNVSRWTIFNIAHFKTWKDLDND